MFYIKVLDSKAVGLNYFIFSFFSSILGFSFVLASRLELSGPFCLFNEMFYHINVTCHGLVMVFFFLTLLASGFSNFMLPNMCFQEDMKLPRVNVVSLWLVYVSFIFVFLSLVIGEGVGEGWTLYVPLTSGYSKSISIDLLITGIHIFSLSSILGAINILVTVANSYNLFKTSVFSMSPFVWGYVTTSVLVLVATPSLTCVMTLLLCDRVYGTFYFCSEFGGDPLLYQVMFWVWGHPEVYILILPVFGVVSHVVQCLCGGVLFNRRGIVYSMLSLMVLSFLVWGHHMVTVG